EDGIRDDLVTGVQTCALPISLQSDLALAERGAGLVERPPRLEERRLGVARFDDGAREHLLGLDELGGGLTRLPRDVVEVFFEPRSEERRVGKEVGSRGSGDRY